MPVLYYSFTFLDFFQSGVITLPVFKNFYWNATLNATKYRETK